MTATDEPTVAPVPTPAQVRDTLQMMVGRTVLVTDAGWAPPEGAEPVAVLCLGPVPDFPDRPVLEIEKWATARPLSELVYENFWPAVRDGDSH